MKTRRHHNNDARRKIKAGKTRSQVEAMAKRLKVPYFALSALKQRSAG